MNKKGRLGKRIASLLLCLVMVLSIANLPGFATVAHAESSTCDHSKHTENDVNQFWCTWTDYKGNVYEYETQWLQTAWSETGNYKKEIVNGESVGRSEFTVFPCGATPVNFKYEVYCLQCKQVISSKEDTWLAKDLCDSYFDYPTINVANHVRKGDNLHLEYDEDGYCVSCGKYYCDHDINCGRIRKHTYSFENGSDSTLVVNENVKWAGNSYKSYDTTVDVKWNYYAGGKWRSTPITSFVINEANWESEKDTQIKKIISEYFPCGKAVVTLSNEVICGNCGQKCDDVFDLGALSLNQDSISISSNQELPLFTSDTQVAAVDFSNRPCVSDSTGESCKYCGSTLCHDDIHVDLVNVEKYTCLRSDVRKVVLYNIGNSEYKYERYDLNTSSGEWIQNANNDITEEEFNDYMSDAQNYWNCPVRLKKYVICKASTCNGIMVSEEDEIDYEFGNIKSITFDKTEINMAVGESITLNVTVDPADTTELYRIGEENAFLDSDTSYIPSISVDGNTITALKEGTIKVYAKSERGYMSDPCIINIHTHSGGTATCKAKAKCSVCGVEYGELVAHSLKTTTTKATTSKNGKKETKCSVCGKVTKTETIYAAKTIKLSVTKYTYDGKVKKPSVTIKDSKGNAIASTNYTVTYPSGRKNVGKYTVKVTFKGNYSGSKNLTFTINPPKTSISKLTAGKKAFTVKWTKKTTQVTGYEIQYSTSSTFAKGNKTVKVTSAKTVSKTISKLTGGKKYYVRTRTYKTVGKTPYYSDWSAKKSVTTKK